MIEKPAAARPDPRRRGGTGDSDGSAEALKVARESDHFFFVTTEAYPVSLVRHVVLQRQSRRRTFMYFKVYSNLFFLLHPLMKYAYASSL